MTDVVHRARGHWRNILPQLGVPAALLSGERTACPICGGFDRFQWFDKLGDGDFYCRQCGAGNAVVLLRKRNTWTFQQACDAIEQALPQDALAAVAYQAASPFRPERRPQLDVATVANDNPIEDVVAQHGGVALKRNGREWLGLCPFHAEKTPSFAVVPKEADQSDRGFFHCFGCGASGDQFEFLRNLFGLDFPQAMALLAGEGGGGERAAPSTRPAAPDPYADLVALPVPSELPQPGVALELWNPKRLHDEKPRPKWRARPSAVHVYRGDFDEVIGCVLRIDGADGRKVTPQVRYARCHDGIARWACWSFEEPRPLYRVGPWSDLHLFTWLVEGEKCADALAGLLIAPVAAWPGGTNGARHCDWSALRGRRLILWPDADQEGQDAMLGRHDDERGAKAGVAELATLAGATVHRVIDWNQDAPKGWDVGDAIADGWSKDQVLTYARTWARSWAA
jgi:hypothetical protein